MELSGPAPLGAQAAIAAQAQIRRAPDVQKVDPGRQSDGAGTDARKQRPEQDTKAATARDIVTLRQQARERDLPAGPPPSFEVSMLEMESDLKQVIARIEAARNQERDAKALQAPAEAEAAQIKADLAASQAQARAAEAADAAAGSRDASAPPASTTPLDAPASAPAAPIADARPAASSGPGQQMSNPLGDF